MAVVLFLDGPQSWLIRPDDDLYECPGGPAITEYSRRILSLNRLLPIPRTNTYLYHVYFLFHLNVKVDGGKGVQSSWQWQCDVCPDNAE